ncbi:hypothetical protein GGQ68_002558 [Sagittula marina]|uniref:Uncharacterized protein n=1 Tax=Sagittula marina TaxID=943940 RepID=A0A7W6DT38_9RHOB|nr:hypothetical protein [Sagittula marina]MBB3986220.1 hypothetical protein [Sagittula marina]
MSTAQLKPDLRFNPKKVATYRKRATSGQLKTNPTEPNSPVLTEAEAARVFAFGADCCWTILCTPFMCSAGRIRQRIPSADPKGLQQCMSRCFLAKYKIRNGRSHTDRSCSIAQTRHAPDHMFRTAIKNAFHQSGICPQRLKPDQTAFLFGGKIARGC